MKNVSSELRQELSMCDEFFNVKWIREMPNGYWVGRVIVDMNTGDNTEQRELAVVEVERWSRNGSFRLIDITATKYRGNKFDELILSADNVSTIYIVPGSEDIMKSGLTVSKNRELMMSVLEICGSQSYLSGC